MTPRTLILTALAALPLAAQEGPCASMPAWMLAVNGVEPYATVAAAHFPLPPTEAQVKELPPLQRLEQATAIKSVLLLRQLQRKADAGRITDANNFAAAGFARSLGCPAAFTDLLQAMGNGNLSGAQSYAAEQALEHWVELFGIDVPSMGVMAQYADIPAEQYEKIITWLPMPVLFRMLPADAVSKPYTAQETAELIRIFNGLTKCYEAIQDLPSAEAAVPATFAAIAYLQQSGLLANHAPESVTNELRAAAEAYQAQRVRLIHAKFFGSVRLRAVDFFIF